VQVEQAVKSARILSSYAVARDFCRIFTEEMNDLYVLSFVLTANSQTAEKCFVAALQDCFKATAVFKDWTHPWARRAIVQNAIRVMEPKRHVPAAVAFAQVADLVTAADKSAPLPAILAMPTFERFVFVLSVLERYSDQECKTLLDCTRQDVIQARNRALKRIGEWGKTVPPQLTPRTTERYAAAS
jgi:DNA-directed RNA polymerase specialized sigma24 family protein